MDILPLVFQGANLRIACLAFLIILAYWGWISAKKTDQNKYKKLVPFALFVAVLAGLVMLVVYQITILTNRFPANQIGILVLRIAGDDGRSLQRDLVNSINRELRKEHIT